jgi:hypothetical protein
MQAWQKLQQFTKHEQGLHICCHKTNISFLMHVVLYAFRVIADVHAGLAQA